MTTGFIFRTEIDTAHEDEVRTNRFTAGCFAAASRAFKIP